MTCELGFGLSGNCNARSVCFQIGFRRECPVWDLFVTTIVQVVFNDQLPSSLQSSSLRRRCPLPSNGNVSHSQIFHFQWCPYLRLMQKYARSSRCVPWLCLLISLPDISLSQSIWCLAQEDPTAYPLLKDELILGRMSDLSTYKALASQIQKLQASSQHVRFRSMISYTLDILDVRTVTNLPDWHRG